MSRTHAFHFHVLGGDGNGNRAVDSPDFTLLANNFGNTGGAPYANGDFNGDGDVNMSDYTIFVNKIGRTVAPLTCDFGDAPEAGTSFPTTSSMPSGRAPPGPRGLDR